MLHKFNLHTFFPIFLSALFCRLESFCAYNSALRKVVYFSVSGLYSYACSGAGAGAAVVVEAGVTAKLVEPGFAWFCSGGCPGGAFATLLALRWWRYVWRACVF